MGVRNSKSDLRCVQTQREFRWFALFHFQLLYWRNLQVFLMPPALGIVSTAAALIIAVPCDPSLACSQPSPGPGSVRIMPQPEHHNGRPLGHRAGRWGSEGSLSVSRGRVEEIKNAREALTSTGHQTFDFNIFSRNWGFVMNLLRWMKSGNGTATQNDSRLFAEYFSYTLEADVALNPNSHYFSMLGIWAVIFVFSGRLLLGRFDLFCSVNWRTYLYTSKSQQFRGSPPLGEPYPLSGRGMWFWMYFRWKGVAVSEIAIDGWKQVEANQRANVMKWWWNV